jgi:lipoprotein-releasing system permease protein
VPGFELFVATRYLRAHRKEAAISVITGISVLGVAAGVMALVIAIAVTNGMRSTLEHSLLGAMANINVMEKEPLYGIESWRGMVARLRQAPHVTAVTPALYNDVFLTGPLRSGYAALKGVDINSELSISDMLHHLKSGSVDRLRDATADPPGIILGARMASDNGMLLGSNIDVTVPNGVITPFGPRPAVRRFKVCGIFETGMYDIDETWAFTSLVAAQKAASLGDVVNQLELNVDDVNRASAIAKEVEKAVGARYTTITWQERNRPILSALDTERVVTMIVIGLILMVAALNIFISLVMMVMEKYRDIAILMSMGARQKQVRRIFVMQGMLIGAVGSALGLAAGYTLSYFANQYRWVPLNETVYSLSFVPFQAHWIDGVWIAAVALLVSFLATLYPARNATRITPAEVLRYE